MPHCRQPHGRDLQPAANQRNRDPQSNKVKVKSETVTPWTIAHQAPLSMGFHRQGYWSGLPFPSPGDLPNTGIEPRSPTLQTDSLPAEVQGKPKNSGVSSLSLLQRIFPTQKSSQGLLYCRWILYQLSYQGTINFTTVQLSVNQMEMDRGPIFINCQL